MMIYPLNMVSFDSYLSLPEGIYFRQTSQTFTNIKMFNSQFNPHEIPLKPPRQKVDEFLIFPPPPPGHLGFNMLTRLNWQVIHGRKKSP
jgi:hypothetical protein